MTASTADYYGILGLTSDATLSVHLKDNAHSGIGPAAGPRADAGVPGGYSEAVSRVLTMLEESWQAIPRPPSRDAARLHYHRQRYHRPGRQMGPLRLPAVDHPHHRHPDKDHSHSDHRRHISSRVVRRTPTSPVADAAA
jgi:hypothetical protein